MQLAPATVAEVRTRVRVFDPTGLSEQRLLTLRRRRLTADGARSCSTGEAATATERRSRVHGLPKSSDEPEDLFRGSLSVVELTADMLSDVWLRDDQDVRKRLRVCAVSV